GARRGAHRGAVTSRPVTGQGLRSGGASTGRRPRGSQVEDQILARLGAADEHVTVGRVVDRGGGVAELSRYERGLAGVADADAARPAHRYVASLGELEQAGVAGVPGHG